MIKIKKNNIYVIMYHYVRPIKKSKFKNLKGLEYDLFKEQICYLKSKFNILDVNDFYEILRTKKIPKKPSILLTFDDGYKDHYDYVYPYLFKNKISGVFYPPIQILNKNKKVLEVNKIHLILEKQKNVNLLLDDLFLYLKKYDNKIYKKVSNTKISTFSRFDDKETILFKKILQTYLPLKLRTKIIDYLFKKFTDLIEEDVFSELYINIDEMKKMQKDQMFFGSHGYNHIRWNFISNSEISNEIAKSINFFKKHGLFNENFSVSYPYGGYNKKVLNTIKKYDIKFCLTTETDSINKSNINKLFSLPRFDTNDFLK